MTKEELFQIVSGKREAWPEGMEWENIGLGIQCFVIDGGVSTETAILLFEASYHRALVRDCGDVLVEKERTGYTVQVCDVAYWGESLIEAYANAMGGE